MRRSRSVAHVLVRSVHRFALHDRTDGDVHLQLGKISETDPLTVRFTELHKYVMELEGFADDPQNSNEGKLEAIQMAWYEEWKDAQ